MYLPKLINFALAQPSLIKLILTFDPKLRFYQKNK